MYYLTVNSTDTTNKSTTMPRPAYAPSGGTAVFENGFIVSKSGKYLMPATFT